MLVIASHVLGSTWSKMERFGSGPTTHPLVAILSAGFTTSRAAIAEARSATAFWNVGLFASMWPHSHASGVHTQYQSREGIFFFSRVKMPS